MGHSITHVWHQVERPVSHVAHEVGHDVANVVRKIPVVGKPLTKAVRYAGAAAVEIGTANMAPGLVAKSGGLGAKTAQRFHRAGNIGLAVGAAIVAPEVLPALGSAAGTGLGYVASGVGDLASGLGSLGSGAWGLASKAGGLFAGGLGKLFTGGRAMLSRTASGFGSSFAAEDPSLAKFFQGMGSSAMGTASNWEQDLADMQPGKFIGRMGSKFFRITKHSNGFSVSKLSSMDVPSWLKSEFGDGQISPLANVGMLAGAAQTAGTSTTPAFTPYGPQQPAGYAQPNIFGNASGINAAIDAALQKKSPQPLEAGFAMNAPELIIMGGLAVTMLIVLLKGSGQPITLGQARGRA